MNDLISVIVPVYNVEKYLTRCVESILTQSYQNIEVILVDDGSTDQSGSICDDFVNKDRRVKVIHKPNGGLSDARNAGISCAAGKYIAFCDSDDWMEQTILQDALSAAQNTDANIVIWGYSADFVDSEEGILNRQAYIPDDFACIKGQDKKELSSGLYMGLIGYAWNKLYKRDLIRDLLFEKGVSLVEDILFNKNAIIRSERITFLGKMGTHYIQRSRETLGTKYYQDYFELKYRAAQAREAILESFGFNDKELRKAMTPTYLGVLEGAVRMASRTDQFSSVSERKRYIRKVLDTNEAKSILKSFRPQGTKSTLLYLLMRARVYTVLLVIFRGKVR